jgi:hypothetical protein
MHVECHFGSQDVTLADKVVNDWQPTCLGPCSSNTVCLRAGRQMPDLPTLQQELKDARQEVRNLQVLGMDPSLPAHKAELVRNLERSARAEVKLRLKALAHEKTKRE